MLGSAGVQPHPGAVCRRERPKRAVDVRLSVSKIMKVAGEANPLKDRTSLLGQFDGGSDPSMRSQRVLGAQPQMQITHDIVPFIKFDPIGSDCWGRLPAWDSGTPLGPDYHSKTDLDVKYNQILLYPKAAPSPACGFAADTRALRARKGPSGPRSGPSGPGGWGLGSRFLRFTEGPQMETERRMVARESSEARLWVQRSQ